MSTSTMNVVPLERPLDHPVERPLDRPVERPLTAIEPTPVRKKRIRMSPDQRREKILEVALSVFAQRGFSGTTFGHISEEAGISRGAIYQYYDNKCILFLEVLQRYIHPSLKEAEQFVNNIEEDQTLQTIESTLELMNRVFTVIYYFAGENKDISKILINEFWTSNSHISESISNIFQPILDNTASGLTILFKNSEIEIDDVEYLSNFILGGILRNISTRILSTDEPSNPEALAKVTTNILRLLVKAS